MVLGGEDHVLLAGSPSQVNEMIRIEFGRVESLRQFASGRRRNSREPSLLRVLAFEQPQHQQICSIRCRDWLVLRCADGSLLVWRANVVWLRHFANRYSGRGCGLAFTNGMIIVTSNAAGVLTGEWHGVSTESKRFLTAGIVIILAALSVLALAQHSS